MITKKVLDMPEIEKQDILLHTNGQANAKFKNFQDMHEWAKESLASLENMFRANGAGADFPTNLAMMNSAGQNTGGIDFDTSEMTAQTSGKGLDIQIKDSLGDIDPAMIQGIIPVNIRLTPITNIGVLFGKADGDEESSDEDMNLSTAILNKLKNYV